MDARLLRHAVNDAESLLTEVQNAAGTLQGAIEAETQLRRVLKETEQALEQAEAEIIYEAEIDAHSKAGPLAGIAKTSPAYKAALTKLVTNARAQNGQVSALAGQVATLQAQYDQAQIAREQATVQYSACKHAADLKGAILKALVA